MNFRTERWAAAQASGGSYLLMHTVRAARGRRKRSAGQLAKSPCQRAAQVILGVSVMTGKTRTAATKQICNGSHGCPPSQQLFSDPLVGNAPIGVRKSVWNPQPPQPSLVNVGGLRGGTGYRDHQVAGERTRQRPGSGNGAGGAPYLSLGGLYQQSTLGRQANLRVQDSHPRSVPVALTPEKFLVGEPGQSSQMTPVGAGQVTSISVGQLPGDRGGRGRFQADSTDLNPSLEMAGAGLEHHTGLMPVDSHRCDPSPAGCSRRSSCPHKAERIRHSPHDCECAGIVPSTPGPTEWRSRAVRLGMPFWWRGESAEPGRDPGASPRVAAGWRATRGTGHDQT